MKLKKCIECNKFPKMSKKDGTWIFSCKCGPKRELIVTGNRPKEIAIAHYNVNMCPDKKDIVITITIPEDRENAPINISCNAPCDGWEKTIEEVRSQLVKLVKEFAKC
jgi:hypothetical protein